MERKLILTKELFSHMKLGIQNNNEEKNKQLQWLRIKHKEKAV